MIVQTTLRMLPLEQAQSLMIFEGWDELEYEDALWCLHCYRVSRFGDLRVLSDGLVYCGYGDCDGTLIDLSAVKGDGLNPPDHFVPEKWVAGKLYDPYA